MHIYINDAITDAAFENTLYVAVNMVHDPRWYDQQLAVLMHIKYMHDDIATAVEDVVECAYLDGD